MRLDRTASLIAAIGTCSLLGHIAAAQPEAVPAPEARSIDRPVGERLHPARLFLDIAWARAKAAPGEDRQLMREAFVAAQLAQRSLSGSSITQMVMRLAEGEDAFAAALRARQETAEEIESLQKLLSAATRSASPDGIKEQARRLEELTERLRLQDEELARNYPRYANIIQERAVPLDDLRSKLRPREALLYIADGDKGVYVFVLTAEAASWYRSTLDSTQIETAVARLRCQLEIPACGSKEAASAYDRTQAYELYQALIAPASPLIGNKAALTIISNRSLSRFPMAALVTEKSDAARDGDPADLRASAWLIDRFALTTAPSPAALYHLRNVPVRARSKRSFRGFGDPVLDEPGGRGAAAAERERILGLASLQQPGSGLTVDVRTLKNLFGDIPYTAMELHALRRALGAPPESLSLRGAATETAFKNARLDDIDILALATHGLLGGEVARIPEPALIFTPPESDDGMDDGVLAASEAVKLKLGADLVILSACNTAGPSGREGPAAEGLSGLARAFFFAGARSLLVSHWRVYDEVAAELTVSTVRQIDRPGDFPKAVALQRAMITVRDKPGKQWSHPSVWAPMVLVGDNR